MTITLVIKNHDGTIYWTENFNSREDAEKWLAEEEKRPYWKKSRRAEFIEATEGMPTEQDKADAQAKATRQDETRERLRNRESARTVEELRAIVDDLAALVLGED